MWIFAEGQHLKITLQSAAPADVERGAVEGAPMNCPAPIVPSDAEAHAHRGKMRVARELSGRQRQ